MIGLALAAAVASFGPGSTSCREWMTRPEAKPAVDAWVLGYWSGLNGANGQRADVGRGMNDVGVLALVQGQCVRFPAEEISLAAFQAYNARAALGG